MFGRRKKKQEQALAQAQAQAQAWQASQLASVAGTPTAPQTTTQFIPGLGTVQTTNEVIDASQVPGLKDAILATLQQHGIPVSGAQMFAAAQMQTPMVVTSDPTVAQATVPSPEHVERKAERLRHLQMLRDGGLITPEELETLRLKLQTE